MATLGSQPMHPLFRFARAGNGPRIGILLRMTEAATRPRLVPKTAIISAVVIVVLIAAAGAAAYFITRSRLITIPDVVGLDATQASDDIESAGLIVGEKSTQVSTSVPIGRVISQEPAPGSRVSPGTPVLLIVSAGPQSYVVPDLIGSSVRGAEDVLTALGFTVVIETVSSETTAQVVLEMFPAPGAPVTVGDQIRLVVAGDGESDDVLLPYDLSDVEILLDPLQAPGDLPNDVTMEVARRLRSLLEAAGATVTTTRAESGAVSPDASREASASASSADLLVGIDVGQGAGEGVRVLYDDASSGGDDSVEVAKAITRAASLPGLRVSEPATTADPVVRAFRNAAVRVIVGDGTSSADRSRFSDPDWADQVARAIYRGIGTAIAPE